MPSIAPCNSTNRKRFKTGAGPTQRRCSTPERLRTHLQRRTLQPTPPQTTGSDVIKERLRDWGEGTEISQSLANWERNVHGIGQPVDPVCRTANSVPPEPITALVSEHVALRHNADLAVNRLTAAMGYVFTQRNRNCPFRKKSDYIL